MVNPSVVVVFLQEHGELFRRERGGSGAMQWSYLCLGEKTARYTEESGAGS